MLTCGQEGALCCPGLGCRPAPIQPLQTLFQRSLQPQVLANHAPRAPLFDSSPEGPMKTMTLPPCKHAGYVMVHSAWMVFRAIKQTTLLIQDDYVLTGRGSIKKAKGLKTIIRQRTEEGRALFIYF